MRGPDRLVVTMSIGVFASNAMRYAGPKYIAQNNNVLYALVAWAWAEGSEARWNPWDTEENWPGATDYNRAGVKDYPSEEIGLAAWWKTLTNGYYRSVLIALQAGTSSELIATAIAKSPWGTEPFVPLCVEVQDNWVKYGLDRTVAGS
jgi:hypothetical protein